MLNLYMDNFHLIDTDQFKQVIVNVRKDLIDLGELDKQVSLTNFKDTIAIKLGKAIGVEFKNYAHFIKQINLCKKHSDYEVFRTTKVTNPSNGGYLIAVVHLLICRQFKLTPRITKAVIDRHIGRTQRKNIFVVYQGNPYSEENIEQFQNSYDSTQKDIAVICLAHDKNDAVSIYNTELVNGTASAGAMNFIDTTEAGDVFAFVPGHLLPVNGLQVDHELDDNKQLLFPNEAIFYQLERSTHKNADRIRQIFMQAYTDRNFRMRVYLDEMAMDLLLDENFPIKVRSNHCFELLLENGVAYGAGNSIYNHFTKEECSEALYVEDLIKENNQLFSYLSDEGKIFQINVIAHNKSFLAHVFRHNFYSLQEVVCMTTEDINLEKIEDIFGIPNMRKYLSKEFQIKYSKDKKLKFMKKEIVD
ncbi:hypothetical protein [Photobacterium sanguinicancri]|uniref:hypothetical protein n=1 Tax=Photobacterium TaxID=657 RepID=UPI0026E285A6|nr:hypothetical protein [Photobacterium sanguinicancri]MDO6500454.1 hypothetical protein [Photobacterium sanguinicancri]